MAIRRTFTLIELMIVIAIIAILAAISIPALLGSRKYANEGNAIASLKAIYNAQIIFFERNTDGDDTKDYGTMLELQTGKFLDEALGTGRKQGYDFQVEPSTTNPEALWWADARPVAPGSSGDRYYALNHTGVVLVAPAIMTIDGATCTIAGGRAVE